MLFSPHNLSKWAYQVYGPIDTGVPLSSTDTPSNIPGLTSFELPLRHRIEAAIAFKYAARITEAHKQPSDALGEETQTWSPKFAQNHSLTNTSAPHASVNSRHYMAQAAKPPQDNSTYVFGHVSNGSFYPTGGEKASTEAITFTASESDHVNSYPGPQTFDQGYFADANTSDISIDSDSESETESTSNAAASIEGDGWVRAPRLAFVLQQLEDKVQLKILEQYGTVRFDAFAVRLQMLREVNRHDSTSSGGLDPMLTRRSMSRATIREISWVTKIMHLTDVN
ncbi:hypothetical protein VM1G_03804 [Cytospora mali]|uniref:Uncharacterized protein n=1 Tax=Cytospora mali TaxID=578113 RepID=A0A194VXP9_CYTMA|nr:hypothetical protein VM1G_03804 [Valsa mali]